MTIITLTTSPVSGHYSKQNVTNLMRGRSLHDALNMTPIPTTSSDDAEVDPYECISGDCVGVLEDITVVDSYGCNNTECVGVPEDRRLIDQCKGPVVCNVYGNTSPLRTGGNGWILTSRCPRSDTICGVERYMHYASGGCRAIGATSTSSTGNQDPTFSTCKTLALVSSHPVTGNSDGTRMGHRCLWFTPGSSCKVKYASVVTCCAYLTENFRGRALTGV
jgi:hypothetical protein